MIRLWRKLLRTTYKFMQSFHQEMRVFQKWINYFILNTMQDDYHHQQDMSYQFQDIILQHHSQLSIKMISTQIQIVGQKWHPNASVWVNKLLSVYSKSQKWLTLIWSCYEATRRDTMIELWQTSQSTRCLIQFTIVTYQFIEIDRSTTDTMLGRFTIYNVQCWGSFNSHKIVSCQHFIPP